MEMNSPGIGSLRTRVVAKNKSNSPQRHRDHRDSLCLLSCVLRVSMVQIYDLVSTSMAKSHASRVWRMSFGVWASET